MAPTLIGLAVIIRNGTWGYPGFWIGLGGWVLSYGIISKVSISIDRQSISYQGLFRNVRIPRDQIEWVEIRSPDYKHRLGPTIGLYIFIFGKKEPELVINVKIFSKKDVSLLVDECLSGKK
jgi:hypothetical protein